MSLYGADGFLRGDGKLSRKLADMEEGRTYTLVLAERPSLAQEASQVPCISVASCTAGPPARWCHLQLLLFFFLSGAPVAPPAGVQPQPAGGQPAGPPGQHWRCQRGSAGRVPQGVRPGNKPERQRPGAAADTLPRRARPGEWRGAAGRRRGDLLLLLYAPLCSFAAPARGRACQG